MPDVRVIELGVVGEAPSIDVQQYSSNNGAVFLMKVENARSAFLSLVSSGLAEGTGLGVP